LERKAFMSTEETPPDITMPAAADIKAEVEVRKEKEAETYPPDDGDDGSGIPLSFIATCLHAEKVGDGSLYAEVHKDKYLFCHVMNRWLVWTGHHWQTDRGRTAEREVEAVVAQYLRLIPAIDKQIKKLAEEEDSEAIIKGLNKRKGFVHNRIKGIRKPSGIADCLTMATIVQNNIAIIGDEIDRNPWLLGFNNGVMDLRTGKFRDGRPDDYILNAIPHDWEGFDAEAEDFDKFMQVIFEENEAVINYVLRFFGYGLIGAVIEHVFLVMHGEHGRNGKSTLMGILQHVLGALMQPIQSEMLLDQKTPRNPGAASPHITALKGLRVAFASETTEKSTFSPGQIKWLTGGDKLTGRENYGKESITFDPTHLLCLLTNELCKAPPNDKAFWYRMHVLNFKLSFVDSPKEDHERKRDPMLTEKLKKETPGILARLVKGCIEWKRSLDADGDGLKPPKEVLEATDQYRKDQDLAGEFISMKFTEEPDFTRSTPLGDIYDEFEEWYQENKGDKVPSRTWLSKELAKKRFIKCTKGGNLKFYGAQLARFTV